MSKMTTKTAQLYEVIRQTDRPLYGDDADAMMEWDNDYFGHESFRYIGTVEYLFNTQGNLCREVLDLYWIERENAGWRECPDFGASYGNEPHEYYSGGNSLWREMGISTRHDGPIAVVARAWVWYMLTGKLDLERAIHV